MSRLQESHKGQEIKLFVFRSTNEGEIEKNHVIKYKNRLRRYHELTKTKETEWINFTKHLKEFYINCTCQTKDASVKLPTQ